MTTQSICINCEKNSCYKKYQLCKLCLEEILMEIFVDELDKYHEDNEDELEEMKKTLIRLVNKNKR